MGAAPPEAGGRFRRLDVAARLARHLLEMVVAMIAGMAALGAAKACSASRPATPIYLSSTA